MSEVPRLNVGSTEGEKPIFVFAGKITAGDANQRGFVGDGGRDRNAMIWRYMTLAKFRSSLANGALFFSRLSSFRDIFEGSALPQLHSVINGGVQSEMEEYWTRYVLPRILVSCWCEKNHESMPMWERYSGIDCATGDFNPSVAIVSTQGQLMDAFREGFLLSRVRYISYPDEWGFDMNPAIRAIAKSLEFEDEHEFRVIKPDAFLSPQPEIDETNKFGYFVKCDLGAIVNRIVISPYSQASSAVVKGWVAEAGLLAPVQPSTMNRARWF